MNLLINNLKESEADLELLKRLLRDFTAVNYHNLKVEASAADFINFNIIDNEEFELRATKLELLQENLNIVMDEYERQNRVYFENPYVYDPMHETQALLAGEQVADDETGYSVNGNFLYLYGIFI